MVHRTMNGNSQTDIHPQRPVWTSQRAFIIASIAGVIGLGNLWRFPYMVGENGGGTFIVAYIVCILVIGLPLYVLEISAGGLVERGAVGTFRRIHRRWGPWFGWAIVTMTLVIMSYYFVITGWTLGYAIDAILSNVRPFEEFTSGYSSLWYFLVIGGLVFVVLLQGVKGIERASTVLLPMLVVVVAGLAIYAQTLSGAAEARRFYTTFELSGFLDPRTWQMAAGQAFYSLGVGLGFLITYGSYIPRNVNIIGSSATVTLTNSAISLTAGMIVFPIVFTFGIAADTGSALSFTSFPLIFGDLAGGQFIAIAFFGLLFVAAFTSCFGGLMVATAPFRDEIGLSPFKATLTATAITVALGIPSALSFTSMDLTIGDKPVLDMIDQMSGSGIVVVVGIIGAALIAWRLPATQLVKQMNAKPWRMGPVVLSPYLFLLAGRYMPAAAVALLLVTMVL